MANSKYTPKPLNPSNTRYLPSDKKYFNIKNAYKLHLDDVIAFTADLHIGSNYADYEGAFASLEHIINDLGVRQTFLAGDLTDGTRVYKGQAYEQNIFGFENQTDFLIKNLPRGKNHTYYIIDGNHDFSYYQLVQASPGRRIAEQRSDIYFLGYAYARLTNYDIKFDLMHLKKSATKVISYRLQSYLENFIKQHGHRNAPDLVVSGHRHQAYHFEYGDTHLFEAGHWQDLTPLCAERNFAGKKGTWVVDMEKYKGKGIIYLDAVLITRQRLEKLGYLNTEKNINNESNNKPYERNIKGRVPA